MEIPIVFTVSEMKLPFLLSVPFSNSPKSHALPIIAWNSTLIVMTFLVLITAYKGGV